MPHISKSQREIYSTFISELLRTEILTKGDLEYIIYNVVKQFMATREFRYSNLHDAVYGCIHAGEEYKRLYLDKREDKAIEDNGEA
jgi:hypothetical protein